jgi:putative ABC transport system ATP-binding protein
LLHNVNALVRPGDRVAIVGPTGAGKSVFLRALARLDPLDAGMVFWDGKPVSAHATPAFRAQVIYLHQRPAWFGDDVEANLRLPYTQLRVHRGKSFDRTRVIGLLEQLGRDASFLAKSDRDLSGGEAQFAALIRAIQLDPAIVLLDEPTASLDRESARAIEALLERWYAESAATRAWVWVTHDPDQAGRVASRRWSMSAGRLETE